MLKPILILVFLALTFITTAKADESITISDTTSLELNSIYQGAAVVFTNVGKRNYFSRNKFQYEELAILNFYTAMSSINSIKAGVNSFQHFKDGALNASIVMAMEDKLGSYKEYCLKPAAKLSIKEIEEAANKYSKGEYPKGEGLQYVLMGVREALGDKYPCQ